MVEARVGEGVDTAFVVAVPEPGQLVEVRRRPFVVQDVIASGLPIDSLKSNGHTPVQHLVTLSSVEDDALGDELRVVWEIEPGARIYEGRRLPDPTHGFDEPRRLDAFLDAVRWGAISSADVNALQAPFRSGIAIEDYQLDPVVRAIQMPRVNLLVADDVGLGKTIESGLVAQELILRQRVHSVLIVCPSALQIQWRDQMRDKFGLDFRIVDATLMKELRRSRGLHVNPWTHFPRLITSIDYLKRERPMRLFREVLPGPGEPVFPRTFDLLIVDEAHNVAPSGGGRYATDSDRTHAIRALVPHFEHKLFLSATPHNGYPESFAALLEMLDNQRFARGVRPDPDQLAAVMVRRLKTDIVDFDGELRFPRRTLAAIEVPYTDAERRAHHLLHAYTESRQRRAGDETERVATEFVLKLLKKRLFSSPAAFATTLAKHEETVRTARKKARPLHLVPSLGVLRRQIEGVDEDFADDDAFTESADDAVMAATNLFQELTSEEEASLGELRAWASAAAARPDSKADELLAWLDKTLKPGGTWSDERVIIFTEYRDTQKWLVQHLTSHGFGGGDRLLMLYGGMDTEERERVKAAFQASPDRSPVRILLATDAASEGIDLQNHCSRLIHYEIPWNPNRLEQRNGRIDRHGQRAKEVQVYHFVGKGYDARSVSATRQPGDLEGDLEFLMRAARKVETIREDLGKVGPVIATQVEQAMLGRRTHLETSTAERDAGAIRAMLRVERQLRERIERLHDQMQTSKRDLNVSPETIEQVVSIGLALAKQLPLIPADVPGLWPDPTGRRARMPAFHLPALTGSWASCTEGLRHPHTGEIRPIVFDHDLIEGRDDVVLAHLGHRLVQMCLRLLRAEVWSSADTARLHRVTARVVPDRVLDTPAVFAYARLVALGSDGQRLHEQILTAGGRLREGGRFSRLNVGEVQTALDGATDQAASPRTQERLRASWSQHADALQSALQARKNDRMAGLMRFLQDRAAKEARDSEAILTELRTSILAELHEPEIQQLALFTTAEQDQFQRNVDALRARADEIPAEIARERRAIEARYAEPTAHLFPVAVTYLIPASIAHREAM